MAGIPGRSGGANRVPTEQHLLRGTFRRDRHQVAATAPHPPIQAVDRRRTLRGLRGEARRLADRLLSEYSGWDSATLEALRAYALSCERLERLQRTPADDTRALHREIRHNLALLKALSLEHAR